MTRVSYTVLTAYLFTLFSNLVNAQAKPIIWGETRMIHSDILSENRTLNISLPSGYNSKDTTHYPVIYLLDGGLDEDFYHTAGLVQFASMPWINWVPESIIVGIANTNRHRDMTFPTTVEGDKKLVKSEGGSEQFIQFIEQELQPYIDKQYRTKAGRTLIGQSLAGLLATEILLKKTSMFNHYVIISPSLWWDNGSILNANTLLSSTYPNTETEVYIGVGKEGLVHSEQPHVMEVDANLLADKIQQLNNKNLHITFDYMPDENHATSSHKALYNAIKK